MHRRTFISNTAIITAGLSVADKSLFTIPSPAKNKLPKWKGFNLLDFFSPNPAPSSRPTIDEHFKWMRDWGFDFVRLPIAYPHYLDIDRSKNITPDDVYKIDEKKLDEIDALVAMAHKHNMHVSLKPSPRAGILYQCRVS